MTSETESPSTEVESEKARAARQRWLERFNFWGPLSVLAFVKIALPFWVGLQTKDWKLGVASGLYIAGLEIAFGMGRSRGRKEHLEDHLKDYREQRDGILRELERIHGELEIAKILRPVLMQMKPGQSVMVEVTRGAEGLKPDLKQAN